MQMHFILLYKFHRHRLGRHGGFALDMNYFLIFILSLLIVCPDYFFKLINRRTGWEINWKHYLIWEIILFTILFCFITSKNENGANIKLEIISLILGITTIVRFVVWFITKEMSNFKDDL